MGEVLICANYYLFSRGQESLAIGRMGPCSVAHRLRTGLRGRSTWDSFLLHPILAVGTWASYLTALCLGFLTYKMGVITIPPQRDAGTSK